MKQFFLTFTILTFVINSSLAQPLERDQVEEKLKWNLAEIYPSVEAWQADVDMLNIEVEKLADFKGKLGESSESLLNAMQTGNDLIKTLYKAWTYASNLSNENLNISENQAMMQQMRALGTKLGEVTAFMEPEILEIPQEKIQQFITEKPELVDYDMYIDNIQRLREHTLTEAEEKILASFGLIAGNQSEVYGIFNNAEKPFPIITLSTGEEVELTSSAYTRYRTADNRGDREKVMKAFFESYGDFKEMLGHEPWRTCKKELGLCKKQKIFISS